MEKVHILSFAFFVESSQGTSLAKGFLYPIFCPKLVIYLGGKQKVNLSLIDSKCFGRMVHYGLKTSLA